MFAYNFQNSVKLYEISQLSDITSFLRFPYRLHKFQISFVWRHFKDYNYITQLTQMNIRRAASGNDVLPTIKRLCTQQDQFSFSRGKTYRDNGFVLKHKLTNMKIKALVSTFVRKLKRNLTSSYPVHFELRSNSEKDEGRLIDWIGWDIEDHFEGFMMSLDIIMSLVAYFISAFQGFLSDFRDGDCSSAAVVALKIIALVVFIIRLVMSLVTIDYEDDTHYLYITDIVKKEFREGGIILHIFSLVMMAISLAYPSNEIIGIIFFFSSLFKLGLIRSNLKMLQIEFVNSIKKFYVWNLIRVIIFNIIFAHTIATALLAISRINPDSNWISAKLVNNGFVDESQTWYKVYIWSYYWACTIMMTVGFGDISPVDYRESIVVAFIQIFSSIVLAYNISEVGSIVSSMRKSSQELQRKLGVLRRMKKKNPVPEQLECKIESYLAHEISIKDRFEYGEHRTIIDQLPEQLKQEYFLQSNQQLYANIPVFRYFQKDCLSKLNRVFEGKVYYPGEYILKHNGGNSRIIIMRSGEFGLAYWKPKSKMNGTIVQSIPIDENQTTGLLITTNILSRCDQINYDIIAQDYSYGMQLDFQVFSNVLRESSLDYYFYRSVLDKHQKMPNIYEYIKCEYCQNQYHTKFQCTRLHYIPTKSETILRGRNCKNRPAIRKESYRKSKYFRHNYFLRKIFFELLEKALNVSREEKIYEDDLDVDVPHDFYMYFKQSNPQVLKDKPFLKPRWIEMFGNAMLIKLHKKDESIKSFA